jgi:hypothetical protein
MVPETDNDVGKAPPAATGGGDDDDLMGMLDDDVAPVKLPAAAAKPPTQSSWASPPDDDDDDEDDLMGMLDDDAAQPAQAKPAAPAAAAGDDEDDLLGMLDDEKEDSDVDMDMLMGTDDEDENKPSLKDMNEDEARRGGRVGWRWLGGGVAVAVRFVSIDDALLLFRVSSVACHFAAQDSDLDLLMMLSDEEAPAPAPTTAVRVIAQVGAVHCAVDNAMQCAVKRSGRVLSSVPPSFVGLSCVVSLNAVPMQALLSISISIFISLISFDLSPCCHLTVLHLVITASSVVSLAGRTAKPGRCRGRRSS